MKIVKITATVLIAAMLAMSAALLTGCKKEITRIDIPSKGLGAAPALDFAQGGYDISEVNALDNDIDRAILLFTYASYNQLDAPYYHFIAESKGDTLVGSLVSQSIRVQSGLEYFHQVLSKVTEVKSEGLRIVTGFVERAKRRVNYNSLQYRYDGSKITYDEETKKLVAAWEKPGNGNAYTPQKGDYETLSNIDFSDRNAIKLAEIEVVSAGDRTLYQVVIEANVAVVNASEYSMTKLKSDSNANPVEYKYYTIEFEVWDNGYFRSINYLESWEGNIGFDIFGQHIGLSGSSESTNYYLYSYDIEDCNLDAYIEMAGIPLKAAN